MYQIQKNLQHVYILCKICEIPTTMYNMMQYDAICKINWTICHISNIMNQIPHIKYHASYIIYQISEIYQK